MQRYDSVLHASYELPWQVLLHLLLCSMRQVLLLFLQNHFSLQDLSVALALRWWHC